MTLQNKKEYVTSNLKLTKEEQKKLDKLSHQINAIQIKLERQIITNPTILHALINLAFDKVKVTDDGDIKL